MIFDPQEGYVDTGFRRTYMPCVSVYDHASKKMIELRLNEAYQAGVAIAELNVTPITKELLDAVKSSLNASDWDSDCDLTVTHRLRHVTLQHLIAAMDAPDPFVYIASFTYQAAQLAPKEPESAERFYQYLARVVTVYLKSHGYYMPDTIYPLFIEAIANTSATRIDKIIKGLHTQIGIRSLKKYLNSYVQLNEGQLNITSNKRIAANDASTIAEQLNVTDVDKAPKNNENEDD
ncbi:MAG: hypothetical protein AWU56_2323 [Idiomarina sp. T82-3]|uniref:hypothetical protein n=1 Tax=Idiomarina TaxID=135575 RepID=UPI000795FB86|nr:hypothetical protein [Idiomarina sp. T82-3]KXS34077.1 MAG: hypothetical protein AWU56_2323 [Idiomarina sp. T82-3]